MRVRRWLLLGLPVILGACGSLAPTPELSPTRLEALVAPHRQRAAALEQSGDLRGALEEWDVALTIEPDDPAAKAGRTKLAAQIEQTVADRLRQGREALKGAAPFEARRQFLAVLALDPANRAAFDLLRTEAGGPRSVPHPARTGEPLGRRAKEDDPLPLREVAARCRAVRRLLPGPLGSRQARSEVPGLGRPPGPGPRSPDPGPLPGRDPSLPGREPAGRDREVAGRARVRSDSRRCPEEHRAGRASAPGAPAATAGEAVARRP